MSGRGKKLGDDSGSDSDNVVEEFTLSPTIDDCGKEISDLCCRLNSKSISLLYDESLDSDAKHLNQLKKAIEMLEEDSIICKLLATSLVKMRKVKKQTNSSEKGTTSPSSNSKPAKRIKRAKFQSPTSSKMKSIPDLLILILEYINYFAKKVDFIVLREPLQPNVVRILKQQEKVAMQVVEVLKESREYLMKIVNRMNGKAHIASNPDAGSSSITS